MLVLTVTASYITRPSIYYALLTQRGVRKCTIITASHSGSRNIFRDSVPNEWRNYEGKYECEER